MTGMPRYVGSVEIPSNGLAARCHGCYKSLIYPHGMRLSTWNAMLKSFIKKHKNCKEKT